MRWFFGLFAEKTAQTAGKVLDTLGHVGGRGGLATGTLIGSYGLDLPGCPATDCRPGKKNSSGDDGMRNAFGVSFAVFAGGYPAYCCCGKKSARGFEMGGNLGSFFIWLLACFHSGKHFSIVSRAAHIPI